MVVGSGLDSDFDVLPEVRDRPDPSRDELSARVVDVIEVPYLKPIAPRRRRVRVGCPLVWPKQMRATLVEPVKRPDPGPPTSTKAKDSEVSSTGPRRNVAVAWPTIVGGSITAAAYVLGRVATGGVEVLVGAFAVGIALLLTFVIATGALRVGDTTRPARLFAAIGSVLLLIAATFANDNRLLSG